MASADHATTVEVEARGSHRSIGYSPELESVLDRRLDTEADDDPIGEQLHQAARTLSRREKLPGGLADLLARDAGLAVQTDGLGDPGAFSNPLVARIQVTDEPVWVIHVAFTDLAEVLGPVPGTVGLVRGLEFLREQ